MNDYVNPYTALFDEYSTAQMTSRHAGTSRKGSRHETYQFASDEVAAQGRDKP